jgi:hypothetical protein
MSRAQRMDGLQDWVTIAPPALLQKERNEVLTRLMCSRLDCQIQAQLDLGGPRYAN